MLNIVLTFEQGNLGQVMESFGFDSHSYIIQGDTSEKIITGFLEEVFKNSTENRIRIMLMATKRGESRFYQIREILYFEAAGKRKRIHVTSGEPFEIYGQMYNIEKITGRLGFVRVHNAFIISLSHIRAANSRNILMDNGEMISIGRKYRQVFRNVLAHLHIRRLHPAESRQISQP